MVVIHYVSSSVLILDFLCSRLLDRQSKILGFGQYLYTQEKSTSCRLVGWDQSHCRDLIVTPRWVGLRVKYNKVPQIEVNVEVFTVHWALIG